MVGVTMKRTRTILAAILIVGMLMACCDAAENENPAPAAVELTASDLSGTANLCNTDRAAFTDKCFARRAELFAYFFKQSTSVGHIDLVVRHPIVEVDGKGVLKERYVPV
jgi:hypothetical protein